MPTNTGGDERKARGFFHIRYKNSSGQCSAGLLTLHGTSLFKILWGLPLAFRIELTFLRVEGKTALGSVASSLPWLGSHGLLHRNAWKGLFPETSLLAYSHLSPPSGVLLAISQSVGHALWEVLLESLPLP